MVGTATRRVGATWGAVVVSLAVCSAVSRSLRHDDDVDVDFEKELCKSSKNELIEENKN